MVKVRRLNQALLDKIEKYIIEYQEKHGESPSYRQVMQNMEMSSLNLVQRYILELEEEGRITRTIGGSIAVIPQFKPSDSTIVSLVGNIACGTPNEAIENIEERFVLPKSLFGDGELFMLRTFGDSMIGAGICKDDLIVIKKQNYANNGDIVVALVNGETTLKRLHLKDGKIILHPENGSMTDIVLDECEIQGILVGCIKTY